MQHTAIRHRRDRECFGPAVSGVPAGVSGRRVKMAFCRNCGEEIPKGARFCTSCGAPVDLSNFNPEPEKDAEMVAAETELEDKSGFRQEDAATARDGKSNRSGKPFPVFGSIALALAVIGLFCDYSAVPVVIGIVALVLAIVSIVRKERKKGLAIGAIVIAALGLVVAAGGGETGSADVRKESDGLETAAAASSVTETEEEEEVQEFSLDGVTFLIPARYEADDASFTAADGSSGFFFNDSDGITEEQFDKVGNKLDERMDSYLAEVLTSPVRKSALESEAAGHKARSYCYTGESNDHSMTAYIEVINVTEKEKLLCVIGIAEESCAEEFEADYREVLDTATYTNAADTRREESDADSAEDADGKESAPGGVDPDLKAFLDEYEAFMDQYIDFMQKYQANPTDLGLLMEYADMMQEYADFIDKVDAYDSDEMSAADAAYYLEVTTRCTQKMLKILGSSD